MRTFTGDDPGFFMRKMMKEKTRSFLRTKKAQNKPGFSRRKAMQCIEEEHDYGEEAVAAMEDSVNASYVCSTIESKYEVSILLN